MFRRGCAVLLAVVLAAVLVPAVAAADSSSRTNQPPGVQARTAPPVTAGYWTAARKNAARSVRESSRPAGPALLAKPWTSAGSPARNVGKVFFTTAGADHACSASVVTAANRDTVVTAAHCVQPPGGTELARNWVFVPGYDGSSPYGEWAARVMYVPSGWSGSRANNLNADAAFVVLNPLGGKHIADVVGSNRIAFNTSRSVAVHDFGYPANEPFSGDSLFYCAAVARPNTTNPGSVGLTIDCDMNQGSSGGPWFSNFSPTSGGTVISVNSTLEVGLGGQILNGPAFGSSIKVVYEAASARR